MKHGYEIAVGFKVAREEVSAALGQQSACSHMNTIKDYVEKDYKVSHLRYANNLISFYLII